MAVWSSYEIGTVYKAWICCSNFARALLGQNLLLRYMNRGSTELTGKTGLANGKFCRTSYLLSSVCVRRKPKHSVLWIWTDILQICLWNIKSLILQGLKIPNHREDNRVYYTCPSRKKRLLNLTALVYIIVFNFFLFLSSVQIRL